jgi:hypothetical protein
MLFVAEPLRHIAIAHKSFAQMLTTAKSRSQQHKQKDTPQKQPPSYINIMQGFIIIKAMMLLFF